MLSLRTTAAMERAATAYHDTDLRHLIALRLQQLSTNHERERLHEIAHFLIVEAGDTPRQVEAELGFSPLRNLLDGNAFGDPDFTPNWEWIACHGRWFELVYLFTDDGFGTIVFIPNDPGTEFDLHSLCLEYAARAT